MQRLLPILLSAVFASSDAGALETTAAPQPPAAVSAAAPLRQALVVAPAPGGGAMSADGDAYGALLRRLGFSLSIVIAEDRPGLEADLRRFAATVKPGAEVAIFVLGVSPARGKDLYLVPRPTDLAAPGLMATEGVPLDDLFRRVGERGPKDIVAIVDACRPAEATGSCRQVADALPEGVSAIIASRRRAEGGGAPVARLASLRPDLLPLLTRPDTSFFALYAALKGKLTGTDMTLDATPSLSRSFSFLPEDFLAKLPTPCNRVEATSDAAALRERRLDDLPVACAEAARLYDFSPLFTDKLRIVREQVAFSHASAAGCGSRAMADVLRDYPQGLLHDAAEREMAGCESLRRDAEQRERVAREEAEREQSAREQAERDASARREADRSAAEAQRKEIARPDAPQICASYLRDYFAKWSSPNDEALTFINEAYAPFVAYYGKTLSRGAIVQEKVKFAARWPQRDYSVLSGGRYEMSDDGGCAIKGVVRWRASRPTGKSSEGLAEFELSIALNPIRIIAENGRVLSRQP